MSTPKLPSDAQDLIARLYPDVDPELTELAFLIHDVGRLISFFVDNFVRPEKVDHSSFMVLLVLRSYGRRQSFSSLSKSVLLTSGGFSNAINRLERDGLVQRERDQKDGRKTWIEITPEGYELVGDILSRYMKQFELKANTITKRKRRAMISHLRTLELMLQND